MKTGVPAVARVLIKRLDDARDLDLPRRASRQASGFDLRAALCGSLTLEPGQRSLVPTGVAIALPAGYEAQVRPRSGLAARHGIGLVNAPGTIDADYRGEIKVIVINLGDEPVTFVRGDRIAQLVVQKVPEIEWAPVDDLPASDRGDGGFGHTGEG